MAACRKPALARLGRGVCSGRRRPALAAGRLARHGPPTSPQPLQDARVVVHLLHEQVEAVRADSAATPLERARAIGYLAGIARKAIETGNLAARLERLEAVLRQRKENEQR